MLNFLTSLLLYAIPIIVLIHMALEVYRQNPDSTLNKIAGISFLVSIVPFIGNFAVSILPSTYAPPLVKWFIHFPSYLLLSLMLHFSMRLTGRFRTMPNWLKLIICYVTLAPSVALLIPFSWISIHLIDLGSWKTGTWSIGLHLLILGASVYAMVVCMMILVKSLRYVNRYDLHLKRKQIRTVLLGYIITFIWGISFTFYGHPFVLGEGIHYPRISMLSMVWFGLFLRYAMIKYDFLPSIDRKYQMLYDVSPVSIIVVNQDGLIIDLNPQAAHLLESSPNALLLRHVGQFLGGQDAVGDFSYLQPMPCECPLVTWTGQVKQVKMESQFMESQGDLLQYIVLREVAKGKEAEDKVQYMVCHDLHTGLVNRMHFKEQLQAFLTSTRPRALAVFLLDVDKFKQIDATIGSGAIEVVVVHFADRLRKVAPLSAVVSRLGEDEFALIVPEREGQKELQSMAREILDACNYTFPIEGKQLHITASMGICLSPDHGTDGDELMRYADMAMYEARKKGRGEFVIYEPSLHQDEQSRYLYHLSIKKGIDENEFVLHYQPQVEIGTGHIIGVEALIRWIRPSVGILPPDEFIRSAEENGSMIEIGYWVLNEACEQLLCWTHEGMSMLLMSINLSARQFLDPELPQRLADTLQRTGINPGQLCLEIKEQTVLIDEEKALCVIRSIQSLGVKLSIDDFGTGHSSLALLKEFSLYAVKIDTSFVKAMLQSEIEQASVHTIITLSHSLGHRVIAKGVEEYEQWEMLSKLRCDEIQGYFLSRPLEAHNFMRFMNQMMITA